MTSLSRLLLVASLSFLPVRCLPLAGVAVLTTSCKQTALEPGGAYTDPVLAKTDQSILDASRAMTAFVEWAKANSVYLARWPEVAQLAKNIETQEKQWVRTAYEARDAYASASKEYRKAVAAGVAGALPPNRAKLDGALAVLTNVVSQVVAYQQAHRTT